MAAIDLERGLEHGGRGWGNERPELMDNFDSEMQEWEEQLQDIQRKIEEVGLKMTEKLYEKSTCGSIRQMNKSAWSLDEGVQIHKITCIHLKVM